MSSNNKTITVLARYFVKLTFAIVYLILNNEGKRYIVTLNANGTTACVDAETNEPCEGCKYGHTCYHKLAVVAIEGLRGEHLKEHGSLAGFRFVAPVVEEVKKVRKARTYTYSAPTTIEEMVALRSEFERTRSEAKRTAISALFISLMDHDGVITVEGKRWGYDADVKAVFEILEIVPTVSSECPVTEVEIAPVTEEILPELPLVVEEQALDNEPLDEEEFNEDVATAWAEETRVEELTPQETIARVSECLRELASVCDGARDEDGQGFNGTDAALGHELAAARTLSPRQLVAATKMLKKYNRTQLGGRCPSVEQVEKALEASRKPTISKVVQRNLATVPVVGKFENRDLATRGTLNGNRPSFVDVLAGRV